MMSLSNTTGHAIRALAYLASCSNPPVNIRDVAECAGVPSAYLAKIVKKLVDAGIVESKRGSAGGVWLARPAKLVSLFEISMAVEGKEFLSPCMFGSDMCSRDRDCPNHAFWVKTRELVRRELERTKLSDVMGFYSQQESCSASVA